MARALLAVGAIWGVAAAVAVGLVVRHEIDELLDHALQESAEIMSVLVEVPTTSGMTAQERDDDLPTPKHKERMAWQVVSSDKRVLLRSHSAPETAWPAPAELGFFDVASQWRVFAMALPGPEQRVFYAAQPARERGETRMAAAEYSALTALVVGLAGAVWLRQRMRREFRPLAELSQAVAAYDPLDRAAQLAPAQRAELLPMERAINALGERVAQRIASERAFSAHAAHALRTPLAGIDAQLAVALRECPEPPLSRLVNVRSAAQRLQGVVVALLALFRSGSEPRWQRMTLESVVHRLPIAGVAVHTTGQPEIVADPDLLAAALANLLDNAIKHGATEVTVDTRTEGERVVLRVSDNGQGVAQGVRAQLAGELAQASYGPPLGLGLMLADLVARAHGGRAFLPEPASPEGGDAHAQRPASGFAVELTLAHFKG
jgi:two-component system OmpR family sensor kinase